MQTNDFDANGYCLLEVFARCLPDTDGIVELSHPKSGRRSGQTAGAGFFRRLRWALAGGERYQVHFKGCEISLAYLSGGKDLLDRGVTYLAPRESTGCLCPVPLAWLLEEPGRERYHFTPYQNWLNDPNGLCYFKGYYHLYYQYNPHQPRWGNPYWGHAASRDLVHWAHLPVCLEPQPSLCADAGRKGGAFSGSAVVEDGRLVLFFTRHIGPLEDNEETQEYQVRTESADSLHFGPEQTVVCRPSGYSFHFRDPKVNREADGWHMFLGSRSSKGPSILHYLSQDGWRWKKQNDFLCDTAHCGTTTVECPDVFPLDGQWVALAALMDYTDLQGRRQPTQYYLGHLSQGHLTVTASGLFDFGTNFYAVQTFAHAGRRLAIGWIADTYGEHRGSLTSAMGSMSLPRELRVKNGRLLVRPAREVYGLLGSKVFSGKQQAVPLMRLPGNTFYVQAYFAADTDFDLLLGRDGGSEIHLLRRRGHTALRLFGVKTEHIVFSAPADTILSLEIFVDRRTVEVFLNEGEASGTKLFYSLSPDGVFSAAFSRPEVVKNLTVRLVSGCALPAGASEIKKSHCR